MLLYHWEIGPKYVEGIANIVDPEEQSDLGLHCLPRHICPKTKDHYCRLVFLFFLFFQIQGAYLLHELPEYYPCPVYHKLLAFLVLEFSWKIIIYINMMNIYSWPCNYPKFLNREVWAKTGVSLDLSDREKFCDIFRTLGRSLVQILDFSMFYTFSLLPQLKIGRSQPA